MELSTRAEGVMPFPPDRVWRALVDLEGLPRVLRPVPPIPGVRRAEVEGGGALEVGSVRLVHLTDGAVGRERILVMDPPERHVYELTGLPPPFGWLVTRGLAEWRLSPAGDGTRVEWTYTFTLSSALGWPVARVAVALFGRFMRAGLLGLEDAVRGT